MFFVQFLPLMLFGVDVSCRILYAIVSYLYVSWSRLITSVGEERAFVCYCLLVIMWFLFGEVSSSYWFFGWAALFYCGTFLAFHIIILVDEYHACRNWNLSDFWFVSSITEIKI